MFEFLADILKAIGNFGASAGSNACIVWYLDEPECPKSLIK